MKGFRQKINVIVRYFIPFSKQFCKDRLQTSDTYPDIQTDLVFSLFKIMNSVYGRYLSAPGIISFISVQSITIT